MYSKHVYHGNPQPAFLGVITRIYIYIGGVKSSFFMVLGSKGIYLISNIAIRCIKLPSFLLGRSLLRLAANVGDLVDDDLPW